jgi:hypothetical protein
MGDSPRTLGDSDFTNEQALLDAGTMRRGHPQPELFGPPLPPGERRFTVDWIDGHRTSEQAADPAWPDGWAADVALDAPRACRVELPCPAAGRGMWVVVCTKCGFAFSLAAAGRADDPRSVRVPCKTAG